MGDLSRIVVVVDHGIGEGRKTEKGAVHRPVWDGVVVERRCACIHRMTMRVQDQWQTRRRLLGPIQIARQIEARQGLDAQILDDEAFMFVAIDHTAACFESGRLCIQTGTQQEMSTDLLSLRLPGGKGPPIGSGHGTLIVTERVESGVGV